MRCLLSCFRRFSGVVHKGQFLKLEIGSFVRILVLAFKKSLYIAGAHCVCPRARATCPHESYNRTSVRRQGLRHFQDYQSHIILQASGAHELFHIFDDLPLNFTRRQVAMAGDEFQDAFLAILFIRFVSRLV